MFLPRRNSRTGALNRYYGVTENGEIKMKGIEAKRRDTPKIIKKCQKDIVKTFAEAKNEKEFIEKITDAEKILQSYIDKLVNNKVPKKELFIESKPSKTLENYTQLNRNAAALLRYRKLGIEKKPGEKIRYIVSDADADNKNKVSIPSENGEIDREFYKRKLKRSMKSLLLQEKRNKKGQEAQRLV